MRDGNDEHFPEESRGPRVWRRLRELAPQFVLFRFLLGRRLGMVDAFGAAPRVLSLKLASYSTP